MVVETPEVPPVVAVVVVHEPGAWFDHVLKAYATQDYPNLRLLFLLTGTDASLDAEIETRIREWLPGAFIRSLDANPGFGTAANEVLRLVDGENGCLLLAHDDTAPDCDMVRLLVDELFRSNAGVVGPKLVDWNNPSILRSVGLGLDRFGVVDQSIEPGEIDQKQHDGVRDVFVLPSACMLVRADLFRQLNGFDPAIEFFGEDVEFCWRVHHFGARVVVVPSARARHRGELLDRRSELADATIAERNRMRAVVTLTGPVRLPGRLFKLMLLTLVELVVGIFTGRSRQAFVSLRAFVNLTQGIPLLVRRRRIIRPCRQVPEREVLGLQEGGSLRLSYFRARQTTTLAGVDRRVRPRRESSPGQIIAWILVLAGMVIGSRSFITSGVPEVNEFLPFSVSPPDMLNRYANAWWDAGPDGTTAAPTGLALLAISSVVTLFRMGLFQTVFIIGLAVIGFVGTWKTATLFPSTWARITALVVYAASPLVVGAMSTGSLNTLVAYAAIPWMVHVGRRAVGMDGADQHAIGLDLRDGLTDFLPGDRIRRALQLGLVVAFAAAFTPVLLPVSIVVGLLLALGTLVALASWRTAVIQIMVTLVAAAVAALLHIPWVAGWSWDGLVGPSPIGDSNRGMYAIASFEIGSADFVRLSLALFLTLVAALLLAQGWALTWAVRAGVLVVGFGALAVIGDRGVLPMSLPESGVLLVPVAFGLAVSAAAALSAFDSDVRRGSFGWRQPVGLIAGIAVVVGSVPGVLAIGDGAWNTPPFSLARLIASQLPDVPEDTDADYRVLLIGDARLLPLASTEYRDGISYALMTQDDLSISDRWARPATEYGDAVVQALNLIAEGSTLRGGRLLAPLGIRYVVIPEFDGVVSTLDDPLLPPLGLMDALDEQLDIVSRFTIPTVQFYENSAWLPTTAVLFGATAEASRLAGDDARVRADMSDRIPAFVGLTAESITESVPAGTVHLAVQFEEGWTLAVDGENIKPRRSFGTTMAFDVTEPGTATLKYESSAAHGPLVVVQAVLWLLVLVGAFWVRRSPSRRPDQYVADETLPSLDSPVLMVDPMIRPGLPNIPADRVADSLNESVDAIEELADESNDSSDGQAIH